MFEVHTSIIRSYMITSSTYLLGGLFEIAVQGLPDQSPYFSLIACQLLQTASEIVESYLAGTSPLTLSHYV